MASKVVAQPTCEVAQNGSNRRKPTTIASFHLAGDNPVLDCPVLEAMLHVADLDTRIVIIEFLSIKFQIFK